MLEARALARSAERRRASDAGAEIVRRQLTETEPLDEVAACDHLVLRSDRPVAAISD